MRKTIRSVVALLLAAVMALSVCGCDFLFPKEESETPVESEENKEKQNDRTASSGEEPESPTPAVFLDNRSLTLAYNESATLTASVENSDKSVLWTVSAEEVITYEANGNTLSLHAGATDGSVTVTASLEGTELSAVCTVNIVDKNVPVESVTLSETEITLEVKDTYTLTATVLPEEATDKTVTWSSSDSSVVSVNQDGVMTAHKAGTVTVSAKSGNAFSSCNVTVNKPYVAVQGVLVSRSSLSLVIGTTGTLKATVSPPDATDTSVTWSSEDETVATVEDGTVHALKEGTVKIKCKTTDGKYTATCRVTVSSSTIAATGIVLNQDSLKIAVGGEGYLKATVEPENATNQNIVWSSSDEAVATIGEDGLVTGIGAGTADITVTTDDGHYTASCAVTVTTDIIHIDKIALSSSSKALTKIGEAFDLAVYTTPNAVSDSSVSWSSDNTAVAKVSSSGRVTAVSEGVAVITAKSTDGGKTAQCFVVVSAEPTKVTGVSIGESDEELLVGDTLNLHAKITPTDASDKRLFWSSDNEEVARVSAEGVVRAVGKGSAVITVTSLSSGKKATCKVTVDVNNTGLEGMFTYFYEMYPGMQGGYSGSTGITWESSDTSVVSVSPTGTFTANGTGEAWVTASADDKSARMKVVVYDQPSRFVITSNANNIGCLVGETVSVPFTVDYDSSAGNPAYITYTSSDSSVCTVDASGLIYAHAAGTATVTANAVMYSESSAATFTVTVSEMPTVSIADKKLTLKSSVSSSLARLGTPVHAEVEQTTDSLGNSCVIIDCYYHDKWNNLTVLSFKDAELCRIYTMDSRFSYTFGDSTVTYKTVLDDSARHIYADYEMTTSDEIMRCYFLEADYAQTSFTQRVFTDVIDEYEKGSSFTDDGRMTVLAVMVATNDYYASLDNMTEMTAGAYELYALTNAWRMSNDLSVLVFDEAAAAVGKAHCADMDAQGYFAHNNKQGMTPKDRITAAGISVKGVGENLAMGQTSGAEAFFSLLNSSGHRDNLADTRFKAVGVGATNNLYGSTGETRQMYAQEFLIR